MQLCFGQPQIPPLLPVTLNVVTNNNAYELFIYYKDITSITVQFMSPFSLKWESVTSKQDLQEGSIEF